MLGDDVADTILAALKTTRVAGLGRTEISNLFSRHMPSARITMVLETLQRAGKAERVPGLTVGHGEQRWRYPVDRWQQAVADGRHFLAHWGDQAHALGWTAKDLFGLLVPEHAKPSFNRLSRYDETGLIWLLQGRPVVAITEATATIKNSIGVTIYRKNYKPPLGPTGDSPDDLQ
jgi:hypothetical protein